MKYDDIKARMKGGAGCLILAKETERFLLILRSNLVAAPLTWSLPGGKIDGGERPGHAARREVGEEIGLDLGKKHLFLIHINDVHAPRFRFYTFAVMVPREFEPILNWESLEYKWCSRDELPEPLHWGVRQTLENRKVIRALKKLASRYNDEG